MNVRAANAGFHRVDQTMRVKSMGGVDLGRCCGLSVFMFVVAVPCSGLGLIGDAT
jgi:hypothetical protein